MFSFLSIRFLHIVRCITSAVLIAIASAAPCRLQAEEPKGELEKADILSDEGQRLMQAALAKSIELSTQQIAKSPESVDLFSQRGDQRFFRRDFAEAVADYEQMLKMQPDLDARHWRLGLAWFYASKYAQGARQFEKYYETDDVDRENGLWRFLCQARESGLPAARQKMLKYVKPDRGGLGDVYRMYAGEQTAEKILADIRSAKVDESERNQRLFYAELYIGLFESVQNHHEAAARHLEAAVRNPWPRKSGYGPSYMWHIARLHCILEREAVKKGAVSK